MVIATERRGEASIPMPAAEPGTRETNQDGFRPTQLPDKNTIARYLKGETDDRGYERERWFQLDQAGVPRNQRSEIVKGEIARMQRARERYHQQLQPSRPVEPESVTEPVSPMPVETPSRVEMPAKAPSRWDRLKTWWKNLGSGKRDTMTEMSSLSEKRFNDLEKAERDRLAVRATQVADYLLKDINTWGDRNDLALYPDTEWPEAERQQAWAELRESLGQFLLQKDTDSNGLMSALRPWISRAFRNGSEKLPQIVGPMFSRILELKRAMRGSPEQWDDWSRRTTIGDVLKEWEKKNPMGAPSNDVRRDEIEKAYNELLDLAVSMSRQKGAINMAPLQPAAEKWLKTAHSPTFIEASPKLVGAAAGLLLEKVNNLRSGR